jgi:hypothetical protein
MASLVVTCPNCQSQDIEKFGLGYKVLGAVDPEDLRFSLGQFKIRHECEACEHVFWATEERA